MKRFYSHGKLLLTGEYVVLDGALSLAAPTKSGQDLIVKKGDDGTLHWGSFDEKEALWYEAKFSILNNRIFPISNDDDDTTHRLLQILRTAKQLNPNFLNTNEGFTVTTMLEFPNNWGLGTSSTLINNIANWANVDPYQLLEATFGGSGYDIACAKANSSLTYELHIHNRDTIREIKPVDFDPSFKNYLYFIHLNQKQNSRDGIAQYRANTSDVSASISRISAITKDMINCDTLKVFQKLMDEHEQLISDIIKQTPVKSQLFSDFKGSIKSLGAWGGDFVMAASEDNPTAYFKAKGYHTILSYIDMIKN